MYVNLVKEYKILYNIPVLFFETESEAILMAKTSAADEAVILIPSLEPDDRLPAYIQRLSDSGFTRIVVVDDGSAESYQPIFQKLETVAGTTVLHHEVNKGKGVALKTGYRYILDHLKHVSGVITADADGQHTVEDCLRLAEKLKERKRALYLGSRDFSQEHVPPKSRIGNRTTSVLFLLLYGKWVSDTQTGLRAFRAEDLPFMIGVEGERFEYEMNVLIACARSGLDIVPITIETIYENENKGSHYHPLKDSVRIFRVLLSGFIKFMGSSLICVLIDQGIFNLMNLAVFANGEAKTGRLILISTVIARVISAGVNFVINKNLVFGQKKGGKAALVRYIILSCGVMLASAGGTWLMGKTGMSSTVAKLIADTVLYFVSFRIQQRWVFREEQ